MAAFFTRHCFRSSLEVAPAGGQFTSFDRLSYEHPLRQKVTSSAELMPIKGDKVSNNKAIKKILTAASFNSASMIRNIWDSVNLVKFLYLLLPYFYHLESSDRNLPAAYLPWAFCLQLLHFTGFTFSGFMERASNRFFILIGILWRQCWRS